MQKVLDLVEKLRERGLTIATAESCTAGLLSAELACVSGASSYLNGAVVAYQDSLKVSILGVLQSTLDKHTAVSREVALEMAQGGRELFDSDICISTTGYAGPTAPEGMLGVVWVGLALRGSEAFAYRLRLSGGRTEIAAQAVREALLLVRKHLSSADV